MKRHASMNRVYRLIWSQVLNAWVCCAENARGRGKSMSGRKLIAAALALMGGAFWMPLATAAPTDGQVSAGEGTISQAGTNTTINQTSQNLAINWQNFNIAANEAVRFIQPNAMSVALNRVVGQDPSQILGSLSANGQVFVINPNGVLFGSGAQVNVGGLVATTLNLSDANLMAGKYTFTSPRPVGEGLGVRVINQGNLTAAQHGYIALLAPDVRNDGVITATLGTALLAAGNAVTLNLNNGSLLNYSIDQGALQALADNKQLIQADGGQVFMSAKAADALSTAVVNNTGIIQARTIQNVGGVIKLMGDMQVGTVNVGGTLDASALPSPAGGRGAGGEGALTANGGFIETSAAHVKVASDAHITTAAANGLAGTWLIDPVDFTVAATGGDITGTQLGANLALNNVIIQSTTGATGTTGNVNVNDVVSWAANKLTLNAQNNININANMNATGTASLALEYGQQAVAAGNVSNYFLNNGAQVNLPAGQNFSTKLGSDGAVKIFTVITSLGAAGSVSGTDLQGINGNLAGNYVLGSNIDAVTATWNFVPLGSSAAFTGEFSGLGHTISNLIINQPATGNVGVFGLTGVSALIRNVGIVGGSVSGGDYVGGLVGHNYGTIHDSFTSNNVNGNNNVGGLVGGSYTGSINNSYATGNVTGVLSVGGLIGRSDANTAVNNSHVTGAISGENTVGGLIGVNYGMVDNSYSTGNVTGILKNIGGLIHYIGGLMGSNLGTVSNSHATGAVSGANYVGGLVGSNQSNGVINGSYATGTVTGTSHIGGLAGNNFGGTAAIRASHATGNVSGSSYVGGLVGYNYSGVIDGSYSTGIVNGTDTIGGLVGGNTNSTISNSYATGAVTGTANYVGGLIGVSLSGTVSNSYATGNVSGASYVGGLAGRNDGATSNSYATGSVSGIHKVGGLLGESNHATVSNSYATGSVSGSNYVGGLLGSHYGGAINNSHATGAVRGGIFTGGLVGGSSNSTISNSYAQGAVTATGLDGGGLIGSSTNDTISNSYATGNVQGSDYVGGLVGKQFGSTIDLSYATGSVTGGMTVGGLVGAGAGGTVSRSYATGVVTGGDYVGGLIGMGSSNTAVSDSYATGAVNGVNYVGGLLGGHYGVAISNSYAVGRVTGTSYTGGLIGGDILGVGTVTNSFWNLTTSGQTTSAGGLGLTTAQIQTQTNFTTATAANGNLNPAWDFAGTWVMYNGLTNPLLRAFMTDLTVTANNAAQTYNGVSYAGGNGVVYSVAPNANLLGTLAYSGSAQGAVNAGNYVLAAGGLYSHQQGYIIHYVNGALTINPASVNVAGTRVYDGTANVAANALGITGLVNGESLILTGVGTLVDKNVGTAKPLTLSTLALNNGTGLASNYILVGGSAMITPASLTVTGVTAANKIFDNTTTATLTGTPTATPLLNDVVVVAPNTGVGNFVDANVGMAKTVNVTGYSLSGADAGNYSVVQPTGLTADITIPIVVSAQTAAAAIAALPNGGTLLRAYPVTTIPPVNFVPPSAEKPLLISLEADGMQLPVGVRKSSKDR
ncbi:MAG: GLUG motif-containing protein [Gallionella sp.]